MKSFFSKIILLLLALKIEAGAMADEGMNLPPPVTARDFYNAGTKFLAATNYNRAEQLFESALALQDERVQPLAEYDLGHVRFADGLALLKKGPDAQTVSAQGRAALAAGTDALQAAQSALADNQLDKMVAAYIAGRGARKNLRAAEKAVQSAMGFYGKTLERWQRADDDFKGAAELNPSDVNAARNAEIVEQSIARLVDLIKKMEAMLAQMRGQDSELGKVLSKLKGQIPAPDAPPRGKGDDDDEPGSGNGGSGDVQPESLTGKEESSSRDCGQMSSPLSPEQAAQILNGLSIDSGKRLPMGGDKEGQPASDRKGRIW